MLTIGSLSTKVLAKKNICGQGPDDVRKAVVSNYRTAKMVDRNFFDKKFKIMLKMCSSDLKAHPESILDI